ncbi:MAG: hypothetical protein GY820_42865 [Gammaproteobacteria bacterium]|nr:hypothetical protein [Gammaproteobacteria bacterium]
MKRLWSKRAAGGEQRRPGHRDVARPLKPRDRAQPTLNITRDYAAQRTVLFSTAHNPALC